VLHEFVSSNREELVRRCRSKRSERDSPPFTPAGLDHGVPLVLEQLVWALRCEQESSSSGRTPATAEVSRTAVLHGKELVKQGYTVGQVVHDYGDICQAITELATAHNARVSVGELDMLNRFLDSAIADAVGPYAVDRDQTRDEERRLLDTAGQAFAALKVGDIGLEGAAGQLLEQSLRKLRALIDRPPPP
jgi:hypothetical protein